MSYLQSRPVTITHKVSYVRAPNRWYACGYTHVRMYTVLIHMRDVCVAQGQGTQLSEAVRQARLVVKVRQLQQVYYMGAGTVRDGQRTYTAL